MGNPSADLDSFISAIVFSYYYNHSPKAGNTLFVPLLNLPKTPSTDLWRLRPEFGVALRLSTAKPDDKPDHEQAKEQEKGLLNDVITIKDLLDSSSTRQDLKRVFRPDGENVKQPIILVDHNAPSITIPKVPSSDILNQLDIVGCIDHHIEENSVPQSATPRIITTGIGSCTTLVITHLRKSGLWPNDTLDAAQSTAIHELARLALAPILIDTHNLKASGEKCSDLDRGVVGTLEIELGHSATLYGTKSSFNRDELYDPVVAAKAASLDLLNTQEMFARDYKAWTEGGIEIGIASLVRPIPWLAEQAGGAEKFALEMRNFAKQMQEEETADGVRFDVFVLLTPGAEKKGKEVLMVTLSETAARAIGEFEERAGELGLEEWDGDDEQGSVTGALDKEFGEGRCKVWWMTRREKTRKQGGPIVREAVAAVQR